MGGGGGGRGASTRVCWVVLLSSTLGPPELMAQLVQKWGWAYRRGFVRNVTTCYVVCSNYTVRPISLLYKLEH